MHGRDPQTLAPSLRHSCVRRLAFGPRDPAPRRPQALLAVRLVGEVQRTPEWQHEPPKFLQHGWRHVALMLLKQVRQAVREVALNLAHWLGFAGIAGQDRERHACHGDECVRVAQKL